MVNFKQTQIGTIPEDWEVINLDNALILLKNGMTTSQNKDNSGYPVTRIETISDGKINPNKVGYVSKVTENDLKNYRLNEGDILFSHINSVEHIGKTAIYGGSPSLLLHGMNLLLLRTNEEKISPNFLLFLIRIFRQRGIFKSMCKKAVNQASINQTELGGLKIPLPPLPEQKAIAEILSTADEAIQKSDKIIAKTGLLKKGLMRELLTKGIGHEEFKDSEIGRIPEEWDVVNLESLIKEIKNGFASGKRDENGIVQIRMNNVTRDGRLIFDSYLKVPISKNVEEFLLKKNDFLFNNTNSIDLVGKSTIFKEAPFSCVFSNHFTRIRFKEDLVLPELILYHFLMLWKKGYFKSVAIRHVGQAAVNKEYLLNLKLPLSRLPEQQKIASILSAIDGRLELERSRKQKLERIKKGLMNDLLTGNKRVGGSAGKLGDKLI